MGVTMATRESDDISTPNEVMTRLSNALSLMAKGDPVISLRQDTAIKFEAVDTHFNAIEKAIELAHQDLVRVPTQVDRAVGALRELMQEMIVRHHALVLDELHQHVASTIEKFLAVAAQFTERDTRTDQRAGDTKLAVDAAFAAAKEATAKIEAGFTKQIDAMVAMIDTKAQNAEDKISDIKDRLTAIESNQNGRQTASKDITGWLAFGVMAAIAIAALFIKHV